jgi:hypothetical protein
MAVILSLVGGKNNQFVLIFYINTVPTFPGITKVPRIERKPTTEQGIKSARELLRNVCPRSQRHETPGLCQCALLTPRNTTNDTHCQELLYPFLGCLWQCLDCPEDKVSRRFEK